MDNSPKCWNDINFKKIERKLLKSSIIKKIPYYQYYKNQEMLNGKTEESIIKSHTFDHRKRKHQGYPLFVLFYRNGLKAIFKRVNSTTEDNYPYHEYYGGIISAYNFARFLGLKIVPPTVIRNVDGKEGVVQLFVENISKIKQRILTVLTLFRKAIYTFTFF